MFPSEVPVDMPESLLQILYKNNYSSIFLGSQSSSTVFSLKVHCVIFRMIHRQKCNIIYITMFSEEYKDLT